MTLRKFAAPAALMLLGACATVPSAPPPPARTPGETGAVPPGEAPPPPVQGFRAPEILNAPGLESVIRADAGGLVRLFGPPRLDTREADMRKLQFAGQSCVLDIYLYPLQQGGEPVATWAEARRASDGAQVDRAACVQALRR